MRVTKNAGISLHEDDIEKLKMLARENYMSRSALVRHWLYQALEKKFGKKMGVGALEAREACPTAQMDQEQG